MSQRTLVLLKPDAVRRGLIGEIIGRIERKAGWTISALELRTLDQETLEQHYGEHEGKPFYEPLVEFMASGPVVALVVEGERVIEGVRALAGPTDPIAAAPGSIRGDFGTIVRENLIHASDSEESADAGTQDFLPRTFLIWRRQPYSAHDLGRPKEFRSPLGICDAHCGNASLRSPWGVTYSSRGGPTARCPCRRHYDGSLHATAHPPRRS